LIVNNTFTVKSLVATGDANKMSFYEAYQAVNKDTVPQGEVDEIDFNLPGSGVQVIDAGDTLRVTEIFTNPVYINGYSQFGAAPNTNLLSAGDNAVILIEFDDTSLQLNGGDSTVTGIAGTLAFNTQGALGDNTVQGDFLGTDATGAAALPPAPIPSPFFTGLSVASDGNLIGGPDPSDRNVVAGNADGGIVVSGQGNTIQGNYVGVDVSGTKALGNSSYSGLGTLTGGGAIQVSGRSNSIISNVVAGNQDNGIHLKGGSGNVVQSNEIGTDATGAAPLDNQQAGVLLENDSNDTVGGLDPTLANIITANGVGVEVTGGSGDAILSNAIFGNGGGISLGGTFLGPGNHNQAAPKLTSATPAGEVTGTLKGAAMATYQVQFFSSTAADRNGQYEGQQYLSTMPVTTDATGNASFTANLSVAVGSVVTATATAASNDTSAFSNGAPVGSPPVAQAQSSTATPGQPDTINVLAGDTDPQGTPLKVTAVAASEGGAANQSQDGGTLAIVNNQVVYTPPANSTATQDSFVYTVTDGLGLTALGEVGVDLLIPGMTSLELSADTSSPTSKQSVTFTAVVSSFKEIQGGLFGEVSFSVDGGPPTNVPLMSTSASTASAVFKSAPLQVGEHTITASYAGILPVLSGSSNSLMLFVSDLGQAPLPTPGPTPSPVADDPQDEARVIALTQLADKLLSLSNTLDGEHFPSRKAEKAFAQKALRTLQNFEKFVRRFTKVTDKSDPAVKLAFGLYTGAASQLRSSAESRLH
jgi:parallel beta-helix repeat protein